MIESSFLEENVVLELPNGTHLHLASNDLVKDATYIISEIFNEGVYGHPGFELNPSDTIVDIGAHVGVFAHWASPQIPQGKLICVEPTSAADKLEHSLAQNNLHNVTLHRLAIGQPSSSLEMFESSKTACLNRSTAFRPSALMRIMLARAEKKGKISPPRVRTFNCWSLQELLAHQQLEKVDLLKIDCEGSEYAVFANITDSDLRRFKRIMMEFHVFHPSHNWRGLVKRLKQCGFAVHVSKPWLHYLLHKTGMLWATR